VSVPCSKKYVCMGRPKNIIVINETYRELAEYFYRYLLRLGYNPKSSKARYNYLCEFLNWLECKVHTQIETTTPKQIAAYYEYISHRPSKKDGGTLNQKTTHGHMRIIRDLFIMLQNEGRVKTNPCSTLKFPYPKDEIPARTVLDQDEIRQLFEAAGTVLERAILSLAYGCGLRVGELVRCDIEDIRLKEKILIVPQGKGNKRRVVPMSSGVAKDLADYYYNERENLTKGRDYNPNESAFMLHSRGGRMQKGTYNKHLKILIDRTENEAIKEKEITVHNLRHSIATHLLEQGIAVEQVRMFLGHSQLETTQIYTHISRKQIEHLMQ
jgi:integrase/recombinase XerD